MANVVNSALAGANLVSGMQDRRRRARLEEEDRARAEMERQQAQALRDMAALNAEYEGNTAAMVRDPRYRDILNRDALGEWRNRDTGHDVRVTAAGADEDGNVVHEAEWRDPQTGEVVSRGPITKNNTNRDDDEVEIVPADRIMAGMVARFGHLAPDLAERFHTREAQDDARRTMEKAYGVSDEPAAASQGGDPASSGNGGTRALASPPPRSAAAPGRAALPPSSGRRGEPGQELLTPRSPDTQTFPLAERPPIEGTRRAEPGMELLSPRGQRPAEAGQELVTPRGQRPTAARRAEPGQELLTPRDQNVGRHVDGRVTPNTPNVEQIENAGDLPAEWSARPATAGDNALAASPPRPGGPSRPLAGAPARAGAAGDSRGATTFPLSERPPIEGTPVAPPPGVKRAAPDSPVYGRNRFRIAPDAEPAKEEQGLLSRAAEAVVDTVFPEAHAAQDPGLGASERDRAETQLVNRVVEAAQDGDVSALSDREVNRALRSGKLSSEQAEQVRQARERNPENRELAELERARTELQRTLKAQRAPGLRRQTQQRLDALNRRVAELKGQPEPEGKAPDPRDRSQRPDHVKLQQTVERAVQGGQRDLEKLSINALDRARRETNLDPKTKQAVEQEIAVRPAREEKKQLMRARKELRRTRRVQKGAGAQRDTDRKLDALERRMAHVQEEIEHPYGPDEAKPQPPQGDIQGEPLNRGPEPGGELATPRNERPAPTPDTPVREQPLSDTSHAPKTTATGQPNPPLPSTDESLPEPVRREAKVVESQVPRTQAARRTETHQAAQTLSTIPTDAKGRITDAQKRAFIKLRVMYPDTVPEETFTRVMTTGRLTAPVKRDLHKVGDTLLEVMQDGSVRELYRAPQEAKTYKMDNRIVQVGEDGARVLYEGPQDAEAAERDIREIDGRLVEVTPDGVRELYASPNARAKAAKAAREAAGGGQGAGGPDLDDTKDRLDVHAKWNKTLTDKAETYATGDFGEGAAARHVSKFVQAVEATPYLQEWGVDPTNPIDTKVLWDAYKAKVAAENAENDTPWVPEFVEKSAQAFGLATEDVEFQTLTPFLVRNLVDNPDAILDGYRYIRRVGGVTSKADADAIILEAAKIVNSEDGVSLREALDRALQGGD